MKKSAKIFLVIGIIVFAFVAAFLLLHREKAPTWQERYDLGIRYLFDGNYQEAIIAFNAAIEIDPKQAESYTSLADAYLALDDLDSALQTLQDGYNATGDTRLQARIDELTTPDSDPVIAESKFYNKPSYKNFDEFDQQIQQYIQTLITAVEDGDKEYAWELLQDSILQDSISVEQGYAYYSEYAGYRMYFGPYVNSVGGYLEIRPKDGTGYYCSYHNSKAEEDDTSWEYGVGQCENWNWNGTYNLYDRFYVPGFKDDVEDETGTMHDSLLDGVVRSTRTITLFESGTAEEIISEREYINGVPIEPTGADSPDRVYAVFGGSYSADDSTQWLWND